MSDTLPVWLQGSDGRPDSSAIHALAAGVRCYAGRGSDMVPGELRLIARELERIAGSVLRMETALDEVVQLGVATEQARSANARSARLRVVEGAGA